MELVRTPPETTRELVLVVDDDPDFGVSMNYLLTSCGFRVGIVYSGEEALRYISSYPVDIVLTDIYMPGMDGIDLIKRLRKRDGQPVIVVTGDTHLAVETTTAAARMVGAHAVLIKPFTKDQLVQAIAHAKAVARPTAKVS